MKRFWCSVCDKIRHVRIMPGNVIEPSSDKPEERIGTCQWHDRPVNVSRDKINSRVHIGAHLGSTRRHSASAAKSKSKKG